MSENFVLETEALYRTGKGNYFLHVQGGLFSSIKTSQVSENWFGGSSIRPVSEKEAFAWCQETGNYEIIDRYFFLLKIMS